MITQTQFFSLKNGEITSFYSDRLGKRIFVVVFYNWGYINIFDESKENEAMKSLMERDVCSEDRDATMENPFLDENKEILWTAFCAIFEATMKKPCHYWPNIFPKKSIVENYFGMIFVNSKITNN